MKLIFSLKNTKEGIQKIADFFPQYKNFLFFGALGMGKTTLISALYEYLSGEKSLLSSPTYGYTKKYPLPHGYFAHYDIFRLKKGASFPELEDDFENPEVITCVEWSENISYTPEKTLKIYIKKLSNEDRELTLVVPQQ
jgi:tRNA threonylcarbamoyladenosine biosynthesis protein TsaE